MTSSFFGLSSIQSGNISMYARGTYILSESFSWYPRRSSMINYLLDYYDAYYQFCSSKHFEKETRRLILKLKANNARNMIGDNFYEQIQYYNTSRLQDWIRKIICKKRLPKTTGYFDRILEERNKREEKRLNNDAAYFTNKTSNVIIKYSSKNRLRFNKINKKDIYKHNYYDKCK